MRSDQASYQRGCLYNDLKQKQGFKGNQHTVAKDQNDPNQTTAETLATELGVDEKTIRRDGKFAEAVEVLDQACELFGIAKETARKASQVCKAIESGMRIPDLSFNHHQEVAGRDDAVELLELASTSQYGKQKIFDLWLAGWTQQEIADAVGVPNSGAFKESLVQFGDIAVLDKTQQSAADHATDFDVPIYNVWKQQSKQILNDMGTGKQAHGQTAQGKTLLSKVDKSDRHNTQKEIAKELAR